MKRRLMVVRHAKSSWKSDAPTDHGRPLNGRGRRDAPRVAARCAELGWVPEVVLSSDSERTRQTWARMEALDGGVVRFTSDLYHAGLDEIRDAVGGVDARVSTVMVLGHNPGWEEAVEALTGRSVRMTTANAVLLRGDGATWREALDGRWRVEAVVRPKEL